MLGVNDFFFKFLGDPKYGIACGNVTQQRLSPHNTELIDQAKSLQYLIRLTVLVNLKISCLGPSSTLVSPYFIIT